MMPTRRIGASLISLMWAAALLACGLCGTPGPPPPPLPQLGPGPTPTPTPNPNPNPNQPDGKPPQATLNDMGITAYPAGFSSPTPTVHQWQDTAVTPAGQRIGYAHAPQAVQRLERHHQEFARGLGFADLGGGRFRWRLPPGCARYEMGCIFEAFSEASAPHLAPLAARLAQEIGDRQFNAHQAASFLLSFVQNIRYQIPEELPFGILPPALVASQSWGDCDSKALLLADLLSAVSIESVIISSVAHRHSMLGIAIPSSGNAFTANGRSYAFAETTAEDAPIGWISPRLLSPNDWRSVPQPGQAPRLSRRVLRRIDSGGSAPPAQPSQPSRPPSPGISPPAPPQNTTPK